MNQAFAAEGKRKSASSLRVRTVLTLFSGKDDLDSHAVRFVLAAKGVVHDTTFVDPASPPEDFLDLNPYQSLPTLVDRDLVLYEGNVIAEYLDERYPHPALMPIDPLSRARIRLGIIRMQREWFSRVGEIKSAVGKAEAEKARKSLRDGLVASLPVFKVGKFFLNHELSIADCMLAPLLWRLGSLGVNLPKEAYPILEYSERMFRNPGFVQSLPGRQNTAQREESDD